MKSLQESLNNSLNEGKFDKKDAARMSAECVKAMDNNSTEDNYEAAYGVLQDIAYDCTDGKAKHIALKALDTDEDDIYDRLGTFTDALEEISRL